MSLEKALQENTAAIEKLNKTLTSIGSTETAAPEQEKADKKEEKPKADKKETKKTEAKKDDKPAYENDKYLNEVKPLTLKVIKAKSRDVVQDILSNFGDNLKSAKDLSAHQYDDYMAKLSAVLEGDDEDLA